MPSSVPSEKPSQSSEPSESPSSSSAPTTAALKAFQDRCDDTSDGKGYVDCVGGFVKGTTTTCEDACGGKCCTGDQACGGFTGKGKQRIILV